MPNKRGTFLRLVLRSSDYLRRFLHVYILDLSLNNSSVPKQFTNFIKRPPKGAFIHQCQPITKDHNSQSTRNNAPTNLIIIN